MKPSLASSLRLGLAALLAAAASAGAQTIWTNASGGSWDTPENWNNGVPASAAATTLPTIGGGYSVSYATPLGFANIGKLTVGNGAILNVNASGLAARTSGGGATNPGLQIDAGGTVNVNSGGALEAIHANSGAVIADIYGTLHVNGGSYTSTDGSNNGKYTIVESGGSFALNAGSATFTQGGIKLYAGSDLAVSGGTFTSPTLEWRGGAGVTFSLGDDFIPLSLTTFTRGTNVDGAYTLSLLDAGVTPGTVYTLVNFGTTGFSLSDFTLNTSVSGTLDLTANSLTYTIAAVPEPSTITMGIGVLGLVAFRAWKRRRA